MSIPSDLVQLLQQRAALHPDRLIYTFLRDGEVEEGSLTYGELDRRAQAIAAQLSAHRGGRALLLFPPGLDYIAAFFGCLYAGVVAVPAYPPRRNRSLSRIEAIVADAEARVALTTEPIFSGIQRRFAEEPTLEGLTWLMTDQTDLNLADSWEKPIITPDTLAFLQYTSGSTGVPKGVMVSHDNLIQNERMIQQAFQMDEASIVVGWLPLYHDMGLIGNVLQPLFVGGRCILMAPVSFLQKPFRWLKAISDYKATVSGGPNFAYDLCVQKVSSEQRATLDLSHWEVACNGAEPVRGDTLEAFAKTFAEVGFRAEAFLPCYGLAESTLFVTGVPQPDLPLLKTVDAAQLEQNVAVELDEGRTLVSCGIPFLEQGVQIVNPETGEPCADGEVGEIWLTGPCVAQGYWKRPEETTRTFGASLASGQQALRTGDLGFQDGDQLYVTGRLKDLIIIRGRNHYPQDIEATVTGSHEALRAHCAAAFSLDVAGEERLFVAQEVTRPALRDLDVPAIAGAIRQAVALEHELQVHGVLLLKTGSIHKTSSGKIQRSACRRGYVQGTLNLVGTSVLDASVAPAMIGGDGMMDRDVLLSMSADEREPVLAAHLHGLVARILGVPPAQVSRHQPLSVLGLDSLGAVDLRNEIESMLDLSVPMDEDLGDMSVTQLALRLSGAVTQEGGSMLTSNGTTNGQSAPHDLFEKCDGDGGYFGIYRKQRDRYFTQPILDGNPGPEMKFQGQDVVVWSINNYLGLCEDPRVLQAARTTLDDVGTWTPMGSRMLTGNSHKHIALEERLARYLGKEASIVFNFGYMGVMGTMASLVGHNDTVIVDSLSHACIVDGAILASAGRPYRVFKHNDMDSLEDQLQAVNKRRKGGILIVTEGVFGMTGDLAPLPEICRLKDQYGARLFVDDAHGFGIMGETGAGTGEHLGCQADIDLYFGTFAKSFAAIGGVTAGTDAVVEYIRYNARTNIFAKSLPMVYVDAVTAALDAIEAEPERRDHAWYIARKLQAGLRDLGYDLGHTASLITPVYVPTGDETMATKTMKMMRDDYGIFLSAVTYPVVPPGVVLFRMTPTAAHTDAHVERTLEAFKYLRERLNLSKEAVV